MAATETEEKKVNTTVTDGNNTDTGTDTGNNEPAQRSVPAYVPPRDVLTDEDKNGSNSWQSYADQYLRDNPIESDEAYRKRQKQVRNVAIMSALADGLSSMANLYYTNKYAPSAYNKDTKTLTAPVANYWQQMEKDRAAAKEKWAAGAQRARQLDEAHNANERNWRMTLQNYYSTQAQRDYENRLRGSAEARAAELQPYNVRNAAAGAQAAETNAKNLQRRYDDEHATAQARIKKLQQKGIKASTGADGNVYEKNGFRVNSVGGKYPVYRYDGAVDYYATETDAKAQAVDEQHKYNHRSTIPDTRYGKGTTIYDKVQGKKRKITGYDDYPAAKNSNGAVIVMSLDQLNGRTIGAVNKTRGGRAGDVKGDVKGDVINPGGKSVH